MLWFTGRTYGAGICLIIDYSTNGIAPNGAFSNNSAFNLEN
jgi:hypothetical protein